MVKVYLSFFLITCCTTAVKSQCNYSQVDQLQNVWVIKAESVFCFDKNLKAVGEYSNLQLGLPSTIDVSNPLKIIVFYPTTQAVVFLDRKVSQISEPIFLKTKGFSDVGMVCRNSRGGIYAYERIAREIILCDENGNPTSFKISVDNEFASGSPIAMQEQKKDLLVGFSGMDIIKYDEFGQYTGIIPVSVESPFIVTDKALYYFFENSTHKFIFEEDRSVPLSCNCCGGCMPIIINDKFYQINGTVLFPCY
jgi:hypothetical protein